MKTITITLFLVASWLMPHVADAQTKPRKVTVFTDDYAGAKEELSVGKYDYMYLVRAGVATVKSIRIPAGMKVTLYDRDHFEGVSLVMTEDASINYLTAKGFARVSLSVSMIVEELPAATPVTAGPYVTIYKDDFAGASKNLIPGQYEYYELGDVDNDQLSSIKIPKGMKVTLYEHGGFKGRTLVLTKDTRAGFLVTSKFNDLTSSILVESLPDEPIAVKPAVVPAVVAAPVIVTEQKIPVVEEKINEPAEPIVYQGDYSGLSKSVGPGRYGIDQLGIGNNELSSVKVPRGFRVTLYDGDAFEGRSLVLTQDARAAFFAEKNFNNITSSLVVETIPMVTIYDGDYSGTSKSFEPGRYSVNELGIGNDQLSSLRVPRGLRVTLYDKDSFEGLMLVLTQDTGSDVIIDNGFNNITSSLTVEVIEKEIPMVTLFQDDFTGVSKKLPVGKYEPSQIGIANNSLSSIKIPRGLQVTLYEYGAQEGRAMTLRKDADMNFFMANGFNDITTSVVIEELFASEHVVTIYSDRFSGVSQSFTPGRYKLNDLTIGDNQISSVKVPAGMRVVMYEDDNFKGYSLTAESDKDLSASKVFNDRTSSIIVEDLFVPIVSPVADAPVAVPVVVAPVVTPVVTAPPVVQTPPCEMTSSQFENAFKAIEAKPFRDEMMSTALLATKDKCMNNLQIRRIAGLFSFEDQSLEFVKYAYELSSEKSEYYLLEDVFKFMSSKDEFTRFLKSK